MTPLPCPHLPPLARPLTAASIKNAGADRGPAFYFLALECAQALWLAGLPAQAVLLINRAFGADVDENDPVLARWPLPYAAAVWIMQHRSEGQFLGNPRRHYQHLATRMTPPRRELRSWRAWACWALARRLFPDLPADEKQIREEGVTEPSEAAVAEALQRLGVRGEADLWMAALDQTGALPVGNHHPDA